MKTKDDYVIQEELLKCRCCLKSDDSLENLYEIALKINESEFSITELLSSITDLTYSIDDGLSPCICSSCYQKTLVCHQFKVQCVESDVLLRSQEDVLNTEDELVEHEEDTKQQHDEEDIIEEIVVDQTEVLHDSNVTEKSTLSSYQLFAETNDAKRRHKCTICGKRFETPAKVKRHLHVHRDILKSENLPEKPKKYFNHSCTICDKKVETPSKLERHMRVHDKSSRMYSGVNVQRPHGCSKCDMRFWNKIKLERHQIVHSKALRESKLHHSPDHTFTCVICLKRPKSAEELDKHMRSHKKEFSSKAHIQCRLCSNLYPSLTNIIRHSKCHPENATHQCIYCGKQMGYCDDFLNHLLRHQNFKFSRSSTTVQLRDLFECDHCGEKFGQLSVLRKHLKCHLEVMSPFY